MLFEAKFTDTPSLVAFCSMFFEQSLENVVLHDRDGEPIYFNPAILNAVKHTADQYPTLQVLRQLNPEYCAALDQAMRTKKACKILYEATLPHFNRLIYDEIYFSPILDTHHELLGVVTLGRDLGYIEQKNIANNLKQKEYLRTLIDSLPFPVWMKNQQGKFLALNNKANIDLGMKYVENLEDTTDFDYFDAAQAQAFVDADNEVMQTGQAKMVLENIPTNNGSSYLSYTHKTPVIVDNKIVGTVGFTRKITEEYKLQKAIAELENEHFSILNNLPLFIIVYDLECKRVFANQYYLDQIACSAEALIGKKPSEFWIDSFVGVTGLSFEAQLKQVISQNKVFPFTCTLKTSPPRVFEKKLIPRINTQQEVCGVICIAEDMTEVIQARQDLKHQAHHDALTGLANRTLFSNHLYDAIVEAQQSHHPFVVMLLDLDGFKAINDSKGHALGDLMLKEVANRICSVHSDAYLCSRLGGDEFAILYRGYTDPQAPEQLAKSILSAVSNVYQIEGAEYFISASIGMTVYPDDTQIPDNLLKYADIAMYAAKDSGRNTYQRYLAEYSKKTESSFYLGHALRRALEEKELYLEYQPIVDIKTHRLVGAEALCRWQSHLYGLIPPNDFIPIAEQTGLIVTLTDFVLREAFKVACMINQSGQQQTIAISVNLSARLFKNDQFADDVISLLQETACEPNWIKFEITETLLLDHSPDVLNALNRFNQIGIIISLDDFGTGQSSLAYLQKFPIQQIKIDRSFVREIGENKKHAKLVQAIISLGKSLDKDLVAEGIESMEQAQLLQSFGCKNGQGYYYSRPRQLDSFIQDFCKNRL